MYSTKVKINISFMEVSKFSFFKMGRDESIDQVWCDTLYANTVGDESLSLLINEGEGFFSFIVTTLGSLGELCIYLQELGVEYTITF